MSSRHPPREKICPSLLQAYFRSARESDPSPESPPRGRDPLESDPVFVGIAPCTTSAVSSSRHPAARLLQCPGTRERKNSQLRYYPSPSSGTQRQMAFCPCAASHAGTCCCWHPNTWKGVQQPVGRTVLSARTACSGAKSRSSPSNPARRWNSP